MLKQYERHLSCFFFLAGGFVGLPLYPLTRAASFVRYYQCRVSPSLCLFFFLFACFFFGGGGAGPGRGAGAGAGGVREDN